MAQQPSVVVIVRHGARIDQADRNWLSNNEATAYNPPLTYGGWIQCQALGHRIATELESLDLSANAKTDELDSNPPPRKKRRIILHSSPYLRCIQTSVAISAGLAQHQQPYRPSLRPQRSSLSRPLQPNSNGSPIILEEDAPAPPPRSVPSPRPSSPPASDGDKARLCIDSFLGEWLSPTYFDDRVRPPPSEELVKSAKEYLKEPTQEIKGADLSSLAVQDFSSVEWGSKEKEKEKEAATAPAQEKTGLRAMAAVGHAMAKRPRNFSFEAGANGKLTAQKLGRRPPTSIIYSPPIPTYSIAPQDAIPIGYVPHARDACLDIDFDWDSQQPPLGWGDGGPYDEEWALMHRRFRNGLEKMLMYYGTSTQDESEELVLVLVSHQAGCNALIRLMTGAPALHDVGTASLSFAVRKPPKSDPSPIRRVSSHHRRGSLDIGIADDYDMKIIASTEHLRGGTNPLGLNSPRLGKSPAFASKRAVGPDSPEGFSIGDSLSSWRPSSNHGSISRSYSQRSYAAADEIPSAPSGLWGSVPQHGLWGAEAKWRGNTSSSIASAFTPPSDRRSTIANTSFSVSDSKSTTSSEHAGNNDEEISTTTTTIAEENGSIRATTPASGSTYLTPTDDATSSNNDITNTTTLPVRSASQRGLWGGESTISSINRSKSPGKRRWTAIDRSP